MNIRKIENCPLCGSECRFGSCITKVFIRCKICGLQLINAPGNEDKLINKWNTRIEK